MTPSRLADDYMRREMEAGGIADADPDAIHKAMAEAHGMTVQAVKDALREAWSGVTG